MEALFLILNNFLFYIRNIVRGCTPLYISICAALLLDLKYNITPGLNSVLYFLSLIFFSIACVISSLLTNKCNTYSKIYEIELNEYNIKSSHNKVSQPKRKEVYEREENERKNNIKWFQYIGFFSFGILGLLFIIISYSLSKNKIQDNQILLQQQIDSLKSTSIKLDKQISELKQVTDSIACQKSH
jgi:cell division protein FtsB